MQRTARWAATAMVALTLIAAVSACSSDSSTVSSGTSEPGTTATTRPIGGAMMDTVPAEEVVTGDMLIDHTFVSTSVTGHDLVPGSTITLSFSEADLSANAGCNSVGGAYVLAGGVLTVTGDLRTTMMACPEPLMEQDGWLTTWLQSGLEVTATTDGITLSGDDVTVEFAQELDAGAGDATGAEDLVGPTWTVHSLTMGDSVSSTLGPAPTFTFHDDGTVEIFTGCTTVTTTYTLDDQLHLDPTGIPLACPDGSPNAGHMALVIVSGDPITWSIEGGDLHLSAYDGGFIASPS